MSLVDVIIPTQFRPERMNSLICQVKVALNQGVDTRVVILCDPKNSDGMWKMATVLSESEADRVVIFNHPDGIKGNPFGEPAGYMCAPAIRAYLEADYFKKGVWQLHAADDDSMAPWALKELLDNSAGVSMVVGRAIAVNRAHEDCRDWLLGCSLERCHVALSSAILKTESILKLARPLYDESSGYADWQLIERMSQRFEFKLIPEIVNVNPLTLNSPQGG